MKKKLRIVFLPYKASMWDSMESVWMAASEDEACETIVMPVPYFDRTRDGTFGELHYEGQDFPDYVPIVSWEDCELAELVPDVIYFHNPYDDGNLVTSIHPLFYSDELRKYTDMLVYIPYFILPGKLEEYFVQNRGCINADKIFVQNEVIRQGYIKILQKLTKRPVKELEKKVVAAGTPKTDKILSCNRETIIIPEEWKRKSAGKKVLFFNTNVSLILHNSDRFLENLERILKILKRHDDYTVIWREHPLSESTLRTMKPGLLDGYYRLRKRFVEEKTWILDTLPEPYPAMTLSDCYFGAGGSLYAIYSVTGKPIMTTVYDYPTQLSEREVSLFELLAAASATYTYAERFKNSLDLFLDHIQVFIGQKEARKEKQERRTFHLDGTVGKRIHAEIMRELKKEV